LTTVEEKHFFLRFSLQDKHHEVR